MYLRKINTFLIVLLTISVFCFAQQVPLGTEYYGNASYYGKQFYGNKTSSGERLKSDEFTCAHPKLPFGTMLEVTNLANNKWVVVRVNDRGPHVKGRIIDLTHIAAKELGMFGSGIIKVKLVVIGDNGKIYISRPQTMIEDSSQLITEEAETVAIPLTPEDEPKATPKYKKQVAKKRANRRKKN